MSRKGHATGGTKKIGDQILALRNITGAFKYL